MAMSVMSVSGDGDGDDAMVMVMVMVSCFSSDRRPTDAAEQRRARSKNTNAIDQSRGVTY